MDLMFPLNSLTSIIVIDVSELRGNTDGTCSRVENNFYSIGLSLINVLSCSGLQRRSWFGWSV